MEAGEALGRDSARTGGWSRSLGWLNPLRAVWWLFTNLRFAIVLLALLSFVGLIGTMVPQVPAAIRGDAALEEMWVQSKEDEFGFLTEPMDRLGIFDIFHAVWFVVLLAMTVVSTGAYVVSRVPGMWASIARPRKRVPDGYFETAPTRVEAGPGLDAGSVEGLLKRRFYRVERVDEGGVSYLFGDRFQWGQVGTLLTHVAVIVFILSAVVSRMDSFEAPLFLAEGETEPVFPVRNPDQLQVELTDSHGEFGAEGQPLDYSSDLVIYHNGEEVKRCSSTVNSPCGYEGYKFYQSSWFGFGAGLKVRDQESGNVVYLETLALSDRVAAPHVTIRDQEGTLLLDETLVLTDELDNGDVQYRGTLVTLDDGTPLTIGLRDTDARRELLVLEPGAASGGIALALKEGERAEAERISIAYVSEEEMPFARVDEVPLPEGAPAADSGGVDLQLSGVVYGTSDVSEGDMRVAGPVGREPVLTLAGVDNRAISLLPGESATAGGYEYTFTGQREFSGIMVKRDRSDILVWLGAGLIVVGVMITFWVPRRRLWAKISSSGVALAGQAPSHADYAGELRELAARAGANVAPLKQKE
jgi:cytochrome c biogenesis protein ResB